MDQNSRLKKILHLSAEEERELKENPGRYEDLVSRLMEAYEVSSGVLSERLKLESRYAILNFEIYQTFSEVHKNALVISALFSETKMKKLDLGKEAVDKINVILDRYLFVERFEQMFHR
ncbi:MAG: hypothetical protein M1151_00960 [Candidatus Thermoplasmatota archaeon]|nr:hypothetical protein [Candidatus Thermoplasmatota archaeon]MCL5785223.1 hypothetical protein [Candidatus Thermoplasmatota archaeon]